jgi:hypothetical protein
VKAVFPTLLKQSKWTKLKRDGMEEDTVLRKDETSTGQRYKYARVIKIHEGNVGKVMSADVEHKNPSEGRFRMTTHSIHKLIMVDLVKEKNMGEEREGGKRNRKLK